jgi:dipeptidyl aminopeptidase/acylaminoacyl peptidase
MKQLFPLAWLLLISLLCLAQKRPSFTIEQIMSSPFPSELTAATQGSRIAWVFDAKGARNVWIADAPDYTKSARQVTHYNDDDGQPIASLRLTSDGKTAVYARGSELNEDAKQSADPDHNVHQPKQQVFAIDVDVPNAAPRLLGNMGCPEEDCEDIEISPDGKWAVWSADKKLWLASIDGKQPAKELAFIRGNAEEPRWSADSKSVAFMTDRDDHAFIGVFDLGAEFIRYMAPSVDKDTSPRWSPDGKSILFVRTRGTEQKLPIIPVRPNPWSLWVADAATGQGREIWHSGEALTDSLPDLFEDSSLYFADNRIIFDSEQDGRNHLYSILPGGGAPVLLTPGDFDVEDVVLSPDRKWVIYSSNQDDVDRRHIWRVSVDGGRPEPLTRGETIEWTPTPTGDGKSIVCLGSSATFPAMPYVLTASGRQMVAANQLPADFPSAQLIAPKQVIFKSLDGLELHGQLFVPKNAAAKMPAVIFVHGGPIRQMLLGFHYMDYYHNAYAMNEYLTSKGYVVLSLNYRTGIMYGRAFREAPNTGWRGSAEYQDVIAAGKYLQSLPNVDRSKIGIWGGSYGGWLTALALARNSDIFKAGVDLHGVHDWSFFLPQWENKALKAPDIDQAEKLAFESSPNASIATWKSPVLLIQGDDDRNVPFEQTVDLAQRLRDHHVGFEQMVLPDEIHGFLMWKSWITVYGAAADFLDRTLARGQQISVH